MTTINESQFQDILKRCYDLTYASYEKYYKIAANVFKNDEQEKLERTTTMEEEIMLLKKSTQGVRGSAG